ECTLRRIPVRAKRKERVVYVCLPASRTLRKYLGGRRSGYLFQDIIPQQKGHITYYKKAWIGHWPDHRINGFHHCKWLGNPQNMPHAAAKVKLKRFLKGVDLIRGKP